MVAVAPRVANASVLLDDQRFDTQRTETSSNVEPVLSGTEDENSRVFILELLLLDALVEPVVG